MSTENLKKKSHADGCSLKQNVLLFILVAITTLADFPFCLVGQADYLCPTCEAACFRLIPDLHLQPCHLQERVERGPAPCCLASQQSFDYLRTVNEFSKLG